MLRRKLNLFIQLLIWFSNPKLPQNYKELCAACNKLLKVNEDALRIVHCFDNTHNRLQIRFAANITLAIVKTCEKDIQRLESESCVINTYLKLYKRPASTAV